MRKHLYERKRSIRDGSLWLSVLMFALIIVFFIVAVRTVNARQQDQELSQMESAIRRALVSCYASEGRYPKTLEYLTKNYGIAIDTSRYLVRYEAYAENLMPDVKVIRREGVS